MSAIHLSGNVWINRLYASVSVRCESMIRCTADLGRVIVDAEVSTCHTHVYTKVSPVWVVPSCDDDAVIRTMVQVVTTVIRVSGMRVERVD
jgi:hypothetical protein